MLARTGNSERIHTSLLKAENLKAKSLTRLATAKRINSAADDAAGLAIAMSMEAQVRGLRKQIEGQQNEISLLQTADGGLSSTTDALQRINELSIQASNGVLTDSDREAIQYEVDQLKDQINQNASKTVFNTKSLLDGSFEMDLQGGGEIALGAATTEGLNLDSIDLRTIEGAQSALGLVDSALAKVTSERGAMGAAINGNTAGIASLQNELVNVVSSNSRIEDADMAAEIIKMNTANIQSELSMKAFSFNNESRASVLKLLGV